MLLRGIAPIPLLLPAQWWTGDPHLFGVEASGGAWGMGMGSRTPAAVGLEGRPLPPQGHRGPRRLGLAFSPTCGLPARACPYLGTRLGLSQTFH